MGFLWRLFAPKPLKKARRGVHQVAHPVRTARRAVTPRSVKQIERGVRSLAHPVEAVERLTEDQVVRALRASPVRNRGGAPVFHHQGCSVNHRSQETADRCAARNTSYRRSSRR